MSDIQFYKSKLGLVVLAHQSLSDQKEFIFEAIKQNFIATRVPFQLLQLEYNNGELWLEGNPILTPFKTKRWFANGIRPYLTITNVSPDCATCYYNWSPLASVIETGWRNQFPLIRDVDPAVLEYLNIEI